MRVAGFVIRETIINTSGIRQPPLHKTHVHTPPSPVRSHISGYAAADGTVSAESGQPLEKMRKGQAFAEKFKKYGAVVLYSPYAYDATWALIDAMKIADSTAPADYLPAMKKVDFDGVTGQISFDEKGDLRTAAVTLYVAKNGKFEPMDVVSGASMQASRGANSKQ